MKKYVAVLTALTVICSMSGCSNESNSSDNGVGNSVVSSTSSTSATTGTEAVQDDNSSEDNPEAESTSSSAPEQETKKVSYSVAEFENLLTEMPVFVKDTKYIVQDDELKSLYPDMLQAIIQNNTSADVKNAVIAFVAWDKNNLPVKIKGSIDFSDGSYIKLVNYGDINMVPNSTFGEHNGFEIDEVCGIDTFKAIVVSFETFGGDSWDNPYYDEWCTLYEGVKYADSMSVDVEIEDVKLEVNQQDADNSTTSSVTESEVLAQIEAQEFKVISTKYIVQDEKHKSLYPDMLQAIIQNNTDTDVKNAVIAFVAWDKNNLPVKIKGSIDFSDGSYIKLVNYSDINMIPNSTYGDSNGFEIDEVCGIETFKAIVVSYETFEGTSWTNPVYDDWCKLYEGVKLS